MSTERHVVLEEVSDADADKKLSSEANKTVLRGAKEFLDSVPNFKKVKCYTTFVAEWALVGEDLVFHFFITAEQKKLNSTEKGGPAMKTYWLQTFPDVIDQVATGYYNANKPRLQVKYTQELASWWFKAQSYSHIIAIEDFVNGFLDKLDEALDGARS